MFVVTVQFEIIPGREHAFAARVARQAEDSLANESGCNVFDVCRDPVDAVSFFLYEVYRDKAAFDAHLASSHFAAFDAEVRDWVREKHVRTYERLAKADRAVATAPE